SAVGTATAIAAPAFALSVLAANAEAPGLELAWRLLQTAAVAVVVLTAVVWHSRGELPARKRGAWMAHVTAGLLFVPWALSWGLI
ncbi:hypothetical protein, partial [Kitasatospora sp. NPDC093558]|uniref:hypothetical protein n=1 Tax=Kitasatospora sp. NPDC093558 TaxID=3155201 RepID=UPI00342B2C50